MHREVRIRIDEDVLKRFKVICIHMELSVPKQTSELIRSFVEIQEANIEKMKNIGK